MFPADVPALPDVVLVSLRMPEGRQDPFDTDTSIRDFLEIVYDTLRRLAAAKHHGERGKTLQPTALVHEAWLKLVSSGAECENPRHALRLARKAVVQVLCDHKRAMNRVKRGGDRDRLGGEHLDSVGVGGATSSLLEFEDDIARTDAVLDQMRTEGETMERRADAFQFHHMLALDVPTVARILEVATRTVERDCRYTRARVRAELEPDDGA